MTSQPIGIVHPGDMGISVAASAQRSGHAVHWASEGRSLQTRDRAQRYQLHDQHTLAQLCATCSIILSVVPPDKAEEVAWQVVGLGFKGIYVDANAIAPQRAIRISQFVSAAGGRFVDGGIIGGPAWRPGTTWLYLAGPDAATVAACFVAGPLETRVMDADIGQASALKMCYAAYTKGTTALLCAVLATASHYGVAPDLFRQWDQDRPELTEQAVSGSRKVTAKAWRFAGEMEEIAATMQEAGLPGEFHQAAAILYRRLGRFKDAPDLPALDTVLNALRNID